MEPSSDNRPNEISQNSLSDYPAEVYQPGNQALANPEVQAALSQEPDQNYIDDAGIIRWSMSNEPSVSRGSTWYLIAGVIALVLIAVDIFFMKSYTLSILIVVMFVALVVYTRSSPQEVNYTLSPMQGIYIGEKLYSFADFRAFGVLSDEGKHSISLIPLRRFSVGISVFFPEELGEQIVDIFGARLPMEEITLDSMDRLIRKLRL